MTDPLAVGAIIISIIGAVGSMINQMHINQCKSLCCESDCRKKNESKSQSNLVLEQPKLYEV